MLTSEYTADPIVTIGIAAMLLHVAYVWIQGIIGMVCTNSIKRTYGGVISKGWALLRVARIVLNAAMIETIVINMGHRLAGYYVKVSIGNIIECVLIVALNFFIFIADQGRFYQACDKKLAKKIIRAERRLGCSVITRISLIFTIFSIGTLFVLTDTSDYVRDRSGNIYRIRDDLDL